MSEGALYPVAEIADAVEAGLAAEARKADQEQAVRGLDALDELGLHPLIAAALRDAGWGVHPEERYPAQRRKRSHSEGDRCDLVLTPQGRALAAPDREPTLLDPPDAVALEEAFWLEIKVVAQFAPEGPNHGYGSALLAALREDAAKLAGDAAITHAGLLLVLFVEQEANAEHDLTVAHAAALGRGLAVGLPARRAFAINDRLGNRVCAVTVFPVAPG